MRKVIKVAGSPNGVRKQMQRSGQIGTVVECLIFDPAIAEFSESDLRNETGGCDPLGVARSDAAPFRAMPPDVSASSYLMSSLMSHDRRKQSEREENSTVLLPGLRRKAQSLGLDHGRRQREHEEKRGASHVRI